MKYGGNTDLNLNSPVTHYRSIEEKQQFLRNFIPLLWLPYKYATEMWIWIMITSIPLTLECIWPIVDALFVIDGQANVGIINHELIKKFAYKIAQQMPISQSNSHVALAQYTPLTELQFSLISGTSQSEIERRIMVIFFL